MIVRYWAEALADIEEIFSYLDERSPSGARNVLHAIYDGIKEMKNSRWPVVKRTIWGSGSRL